MPAPSSFTLLLITSGSLCRAEISGTPPRVAKLHQPPRPAQGTLADLVEAAARPGGKLRGPVWILAEDAFVQVLKLNPDAVQGLKDEEIGRALSYEAQVVSGMAPAEAALGWIGVKGSGREREFQVVQVARSERERVEAVVRRLGGRLAGIAHPSGLPTPMNPEANGSAWGRLEVWRGMYSLVENPDGAGIRARVMPNVGPRSLRAISGSENATEVLIGSPEGEPADLEGMPVFRLDEDASLRWWLEAWAEVLRRPQKSMAAVLPEEKPLSNRSLVAVGVAVLLLVAAGCAWHARGLKAREESLGKDLAEAKIPGERIGKVKQDISAKGAELKALQAHIAPSGLPPGGHFKRILEALASRRPAGVILSRLDLGWEDSKVQGQSVASGGADALAAVLTQALKGDKREATAGGTRLLMDGDSAGLYEFEVKVAPGAKAANSK